MTTPMTTPITTATSWRRARIRAIETLNADTRLFEIEPDGVFAPSSPGGHIDVAVQIDGRPATRSYSTLEDSAHGAYRIAVKQVEDSRGGSVWMHRLEPGAQISISAPANHFELNRHAKRYLLVAGGIGITPIYAMANALAQDGADFRVLYACRDRQSAILADNLRTAIGERLSVFAGSDGRRLDLAAEIGALPDDAEVYVCGPIPMLDEAREIWAASGRPIDRLRFETFANSGRFPNAAFSVNLPHIGRSVEVAKNQTILEALEAAGIDAMYDCRRGECGLCALDVLAVDGVIDHRDVFFSAEEKAEGKKLCACVSRVAGKSITVDTGERRG
ncbi:MAG: 2Fe-2S iron-sulfur cluster-binding protein [Beijerinckiaceae bacterium]